MSAQIDDFNNALERAAGLTLDATCELRAAGARSLPHPHRRLLISATRSLERAQDTLHTLRTEPWQQSQHPKPRQMSML